MNIYQQITPISDESVQHLTPENIKITTVELTVPNKLVKDTEVTIAKLKVTQHDYKC